MSSVKPFYFPVFVTFLVALCLTPVGVRAQTVEADIAISSGLTVPGDQQSGGNLMLDLDGGESIVIEVFSDSFGGQQGVAATFEFSDPSAIDATKITGTNNQYINMQASGGIFFTNALPLVVRENRVDVTWALLGGTAPPAGFQFLGNFRLKLNPSFSGPLTITLVELAIGADTIVQPNIAFELLVAFTLPKTFEVDLNGRIGNQGVTRGRANPGGRFGVQLFGGNLDQTTSIEIQAEIDPTAVNPGLTGFQAAPPFVAVPAGETATLPTPSASSFPNGKVDIQRGRGDGMLDDTSTSITAGAGETVAIEFYGNDFPSSNGFRSRIRVSDPNAITRIRSIPGLFNGKFGEPSLSGDVIQLELISLMGTLGPPIDLLTGTLLVDLAPGFNGVAFTIEDIAFVSATSSVTDDPGAVLVVVPPGGVKESLVGIEGNTLIFAAESPTPVDGNVPLGVIQFQTRADFRNAQITFSRATYIADQTPSTIQPDITLMLGSIISDAPAVTNPPAPVLVTDEIAVIGLRTNRLATVEVIYGADKDNLNLSATTTDLREKHRVHIDGLDAGSRYFYQVILTDDKQRQSDPFPLHPLFFVTRRMADTVPPRVIRGPAAVGLTTDGATIVLETDEAATIEIIAGADSTDLSQSYSSGADARRANEIRLTGLTPGTTYFYRARATDVLGNVGETRIRKFALRATADVRAPRVVGRPSVASAFSAAVIRWVTTEQANTAAFFGVTSELGDSVVIEESVNEHQVALSNLLSETEYFYQVRSLDASGNAVLSPLFTFKTRSEEDLTAPVIVRPPVVPRRSDAEALVVFETNEPATVTIQYDSLVAVLSDDTGVLGESVSTTDAARRQEIRLTNLVGAKKYFYQILLTDLSGNSVTYTVNDEIPELSFATRGTPDTEPPVVFSKPVPLGITADGVTINWAANEPHSAIIRYGVASGADFTESVEDLEVSRRHAVPISGLESGVTYAYEVVTIDTEGNESINQGIEFTTRTDADTNPPRITRPPRVVNVTNESATIEWPTNEPSDSRVAWGPTIDYTDKIEIVEGTQFHSITLTGLEASTLYHFAVGSADASGNVVTTDANGTIPFISRDYRFRTRASANTRVPIILTGPLAEIRSNLVVLRWRTDKRSTSRVAVGVLEGSAEAAGGAPVFGDPSEIVFEENDLVRNHSITVTGLQPGLSYLFQISSTDASGLTVFGQNPTAAAKQVPGGLGSFITTTEVDTQFPVITGGPTVVASTSTSLTVEWETDESGNSTVDFGTNESTLDQSEISGTNETAHQLVLTNLDAGTTYAYQVGSTDASGNGATKSAVVFSSTDASEDLIAPAITTDPSVIYKNDIQATVSWVTNEAADGQISFGTSADNLDDVLSEDDFDTEHTITLTNLTAGTEYFYQVASIDQNNNGPTTSGVLSFTTDSTPDQTNPVVNDVSFVVSDNEAVITWSTDELSDSAVKFGPSGSLDFNAGSADDVTEHSVTLTNLTAGAEYTFVVESIDRSGNGPTASTSLTFTTLAEGAALSVAAPTGLAATGGNGVVQITWTASTSGGITANVIERAEESGDFFPIATIEDIATFVDENVVNGTSYTYRIRAVGLQQTQSDPSETAAVTPAANQGPSAPTLFVLQGDPSAPTLAIRNSSPLNAGDELTYTFQISTQEDFSDAVTIRSGLAEGTGVGAGDAAGVTAWTVDRTLENEVTYHYRVQASDGTFRGAFLTGAFTVNTSLPHFPGDLTGDLVVDFSDFVDFARAFSTSEGSPSFNANADLDGSGTVNFDDFLAFAKVFAVRYIQGEAAASKPVLLAATYGVDAVTRIDLVGRPFSTESDGEWVIDVKIGDAQNLRGLGIRLDYDPGVLEFVDVSQSDGALLRANAREADTFGVLEYNVETGELFIAGSVTTGDAVTATQGTFAQVRFNVLEDQPQGDLINLIEGYTIDGEFGVNLANNLGAHLALLPDAYALDRNFPNPFNPETTIRYAVPEAGNVSLIVYNILGQEVVTLSDERHAPGFYVLRWDGRDQVGRGVASGVYLYRMQANGKTESFTQVHKMLLLK